MHRTLLLRFAAILLGLFAVSASTTLTAQPAPIRFTEHLGYDFVHGFAKIQSAAIRNGTTLVVWGATRTGGDGASIGQLYYQSVRLGDSGSPRLMLDSSFRPASYVAVIPLEKGFLVWWNDLRPDRPGLYTHRFDLDGELDGAPEFFHASSISDTANVRVLVGLSGRTFIWNDGERRLFVHRIARDGRVLIDRASVGNGLSGGTRRLLGIDDLVAVPTDNGVVIIDALHRIVPAAASAGMLDGIHRLLPDSSFAWMRDSTVFVARSLYQGAPIDTFVLPVPKTVLPFCALTVSTAGALELSWPVVLDVPSSMQSISIEIAQIDVRRGPPYDPRRLATITERTEISSSRPYYVRLTAMKRTHHCDNSAAIVYTFEHKKDLGGYRGTETKITQRGHVIANDGTVTADGPVAPTNGACPDTDTTFRSVAIVRVAGGLRRSAVRVANTVLSVPSELFRRKTAEFSPNVVLAGDTVRVTFASSWDRGHFGLIDWRDAGAEASPELPGLRDEPNRTETEAMILVPGASIIARSVVGWFSPPEGGYYPTGGRSEAILIGRSWNRLFVDGNLSRPQLTYGLSLAGTEIASYRLYGRTAVVTMGELLPVPRWTIEFPDSPASQRIVAIDAGRALVLRSEGSSNIAARIAGPGITSSSFNLAISDSLLAALPGGGDRFYLVGRSWSVDTVLRLTLVSLDGSIATSTIATLPGGRDLFCFVDRADTSVVLLAATVEGIHMARLGAGHPSNPWVSVVREDSVREPSAIFHGDSLYIAWTRSRGSESDIEGIALARTAIPIAAPDPPADSTAATSVAGSLSIDGIFPTPATGTGTIRLLIDAPCTITLSIFDARGELVETLSYEASAGGPHDVPLDVSQYLNGIYTVRATSGAVRADARLNVVHDWK